MGPRDRLVNLREFGRVQHATWRPIENPADQIVEKAAKIQYLVGLRVRRTLDAHGVTIGDFAQELHTDAEGLRRKLRGEKWASLQDIASWSLALGVDLIAVAPEAEPDDSRQA